MDNASRTQLSREVSDLDREKWRYSAAIGELAACIGPSFRSEAHTRPTGCGYLSSTCSGKTGQTHLV